MSTRKIQDVYPLSPLQEGMLFHSLYEPESGLYVEQVSFDLVGGLDAALLERAWGRVVERHPVLRTSFVWKKQPKPLQVVLAQVELPFERLDWSGLVAEEQEARFAELLAADRDRGFELSRPPLMRIALVKLGERRHRLLWTAHHLLLDGWSLPLLLNEVFGAYAAFAAGREPRFAPSRPFGEYVAWLQRQDLGAAEAFWRRELRGFTSPLELPAGAGRRTAESAPARQGREGLTLSAADTAALAALAQRARLTPNVLVQAAWALLLGRHAGTDDVVFGVTVSGRGVDFPGVQSMLGLFINTLPLRARIPAAAPLLAWLRGLQGRQLEMQRFEHSPLPEVQKWSDVPRGTPLFETLLAFENYPVVGFPGEGDGEAGLRLEGVAFHGWTNYPLAVAALPGERLHLRIDHDAARYDAVTVRRMLGHFAALLAGLAAAMPETVPADLPLLTPAERHQLTAEWNDVRSEYPSRPVHEIFREVAARAPGALAVEFHDGALTYGELDRLSDGVARRLLALGVRPGTPVGIATLRSAAMAAGLLGILKAGGAYVPLDPSYPAERLAFLAADSGLRVVLTGELPAPLPVGDEVRCVPLSDPADAGDEGAPPRVPVPDSALAYVTYTSGSTGLPKGTGIPHRAICRLVFETGYLPFGPDERVGQMANLSFDAATFELWGALLHGAAVVGISRDTALSSERLEGRLRDGGVTALFVTTALFNQVVRERPEAFLGLRHLLFGGEASDPGTVRDLLARGFAGRLLHVYGPTESTTFATWLQVREVPEGASTVPIGRPLTNTTAYVLDPDRAPVPAGVPGELYLGGDGLAQGYHGRRELTAEKFVPDPFSAAPGARLYRTGDRVRLLPGGEIEFLGRLDDQVKIRGFRIEPGEIEALLGTHPEVGRSAVVVRGEGNDRRLVAFVVPRPGSGLDAPGADLGAALREYLRGRVPDYMVPSAFQATASIPLNANGKVDRKALSAMTAGSAGAAGAAPAVGPSETAAASLTAVEAALARVWADVLRVEKVGPHDDFFELGGDSILSIQIVARANQAGVRITPRQLFDHPTVAALAAAVAGEGTATTVAAAEQGPVTGDVPLTPIQRRFFAAVPPEPHHFNQGLLLRVRQPLAPAAAARAVAALLAHHDALRLRFAPDGTGGWRQWNAAPEGPVPFVRLDLSGLGETAAAALAAAADQVQASLDLTAGPLVRAAWIALPAGEERLLVAVHHLAVDGVSWRVLLEDLETACRQASRDEGVALPPKTTSFRAWAERLAEHARTMPLEPELGGWLRDGARPVDPLTSDFPAGPDADSFAAARSVVVTLDAEETRALLQEVPRAWQTQINDVLLTALARALAGPRGALRVALEGHGREEVLEGVDLSRTVGWFTAVYPVSLEVEPDADPAAALLAVREQLRAVPERGIGHGLLRWLRGDAAVADALAALPEPEVAFNYLGQLDQAIPAGSLFEPAAESAGTSESPRGRRWHPLAVNARVLGGRLEADWSYSGLRHRRETVEAWAGAFAAALRELIARARETAGRRGASPADFPLAGLPAAELAQVLSAEGEVEDVYALSPLQEGLLFHSLYAPGFGVYVEQLTCTVAGEIDAAAFEAAWRLVVERNPILRTSFRGLDLSRPVQVVHPRAEVALEREDWRGLSAAEREERLEELVRDDRARGFDLSRPPLMRWRLIATGEGEHRFFWTYHHVLFDGWSFSALVGEALAAYAALRAGADPMGAPGLPERRPYRDYIAWLQERDLAATEAYWRRALAGWSAPTPLAVDREAGEGAGGMGAAGTVLARLTAEATSALQARARRARVTLNTLVQGAWGLLLARYAGAPEAVFGAVVSGRPAGLPGVEEMVGLFINTLPVRVESAPGQPLAPWLARLQEANLELRQYEHSPLVKIQQWSEVPRGLPLFESILAFESYPLETALARSGGGFGIGEVRTFSRASHPLSVAAFPGEELLLRIDYEAERFDAPTARRVLAHLQSLLEGMAAAGDEARLGDLPLLGAAERHQLLTEWTEDGAPAPRDAWGGPAPAGVPGLAGDGLARRRDDGALEPLATDPRAARLERRLRALSAAAPDAGAAGHPIAGRLAAIWAEVLGVERVGPRDDFFALGGHSLLLTQVVSRVRAAFGVELPLASLFERPTVEEVTAELETLLAQEKGLAALPMVPVPRHADGEPLSFAQERLWFIDQLEPGSSLYNIPAAVRLRGRLDAAALAAVIAEIVRRHESLRTTFAPRGGRAVQAIAPALDPGLPRVDLSGLGAARREAELRRLAAEEAGRPFDLAAGPLVRAVLVRLGEEEHAALWTMHHIVSDGWSMGVFLRELAALYGAFAEGRPSPLPALAIQYADFAQWQRRWLAGEVLERQLAYWRERLAGAPATLDLPADRPRRSRPSLRRGEERAVLPRAATAALAALAQREGATLFMALLAAFQAVLARWTGSEDLVVGSPIANRNRVEIEGLIGFFVNTLVLRADLAGDPDFRTLLARAQAAALGAYAHQDLPFERLVEELAPVRNQGHSPLFQAMFALQNAPAGDLALPGLELAPLDGEGAASEFELTLNAVEREDGLALSLGYSSDLYDPARMRRLLGHLTVLAAAAAERPELRLSELPLLAPAERHQVAVEWGGGEVRVLDGRGNPVPAGTPGEVVRGGERTGERGSWTAAGRLELATAGTAEQEPAAVPTRAAGPRLPATPTEELVAAVWASLLGRGAGEIAADDDFFALGGHSLLAAQAASRLREAFGAELPLRLLFEAPTLGELAAAVDEELRRGTGVLLPPIAPAPRPAPLSFQQQRLWILDRFDPGLPAYNMPFPVLLSGDLDAAALEGALAGIVRRHEVLRSRVAETPAGAVQEALPLPVPEDGLRLPRVDLRALPAAARREEAARLAVEESWRRFDLSRGPLLRAVLVHLEEGEHHLLLTMHHIASDAASVDVFLAEMTALYAAFAAGRPSPLPEPALQYGDYAAWQQAWMAGDALDAQVAWWRERLAGAPGLELPTDRPRPALQTFRGASVPLRLDAGLSRGLRTLGQERGATLFMVVLAGFQALLHRYTGQEDVVVGSPISNRDRPEVEGLVGFFVNMLAVRARPAAATTFAGLLAQVREAALGGFTHRDLPFERLVEAVAPERDPSRNPLFQVVAQVLPGAAAPASGPAEGLAVHPIALREEMAPFELSLTAVELPDGLQGALQHNAGLLDATTARRLVRHLEALLAAAAADPERTLGELPLFTAAEAHQLRVEWNERREREAAGPFPHEAFAALAAREPGAPAVATDAMDGGVRLTRGELDAQAERLARRLRRLGARPDVLVVVALERSAELVVALLAVAKAGAAFVPLDPGYPRERQAYLLADCGAPVVVTRRALAERLPETAAAVVLVDEPMEADRAEEPAVPAVRPEPASLAYVIYTSGSTGRPKGVAVAYANLANLAAWVVDHYGLGAADRVSLISTPSFDASVFELWPALSVGAGLHVPDDEVRLSPARLAAWLRDEAITAAQLATPLAEALLVHGLPAGMSLRALGTGGDRLRRRPPAGLPFPLRNQYGPTEITSIATSGDVEPGAGAALPSIGRPRGGAAVQLLDRDLRPVPLGAAGEVVIGGPGVARGYLGRPDLTAERFVPDPSGPPGARAYRTGDLARLLPDGRIDFLGRLDHQVKVRGFRIELGGVESVLGSHPGVAEAVVLARETAGGGRRLVAYLVPREEAPAGLLDSLRDYLRERLPEFEVPSAFVVLGALPLDPNGKIDRRALPEPGAPEAGADGGAEAGGEPRTPVEELLVTIWHEVLGAGRVGIHDSFFDLGGHSLLATRMASRLRDAFGVEVPLRHLFESPTVAGLALEVERALRAGADPAPPLVPAPRGGDLPLSFAQQRLWVLDQLDPGSPAYNVPLAVRLAGDLDAAALERSLGEVVRRHEALRTAFPARRGGPAQEIAPFTGLALPRADLSALPEPARRAEAHRLAAEEARRPFDLAHGPVLRQTLLRLGEREHVLLLGMHHIVSDGWSTGVLVREISALYGAFRAGLPSPLPELPVQYADYAVWQRSWLSGETLERELAWWRATLEGAPVLELPTDRPHPAVPGHAAASRPVWVPAETAAGVSALARAEGVTPFMVLLAAWSTLLFRYTGQRDLAVGSPIANRQRSEVEGLIGFFVNTLVLRTVLPEGPEGADGREALRRVRETTLGAYAHQDVPFDLLVDRLHGRRSIQRTPFFQSVLALQNTPMGAAELPGLELAPMTGGAAETGAAKFELTLSLGETADGLRGGLEYRRDLFDPATVERLLAHFQAVLAALAADPGTDLAALPLLAPAERHQLLAELNDNASDYPRESALHRLFERRAAVDPAALAVSFGGERLSYGELDARANQVARALRRMGVGPEVPVGVCLERSAGLVVALLATLKAGGYYVPLDPAYPPERLAAMAEDARLTVLVAEERTVPAVPPENVERIRLLLLDADRAALDAEDSGALPAGTTEGIDADVANLAYAIYTSGSTGRPKGVAVTHRDVARLVLESDYVRLGDSDRVAQASNASFDAATFEIWGALLAGARLVGVPREVTLEPRGFAGFLRAEGITTLFITTALFHQLAREVPDAFSGLRQLLFGGEAIDPAAVRRVLRAGGPERLLHVYGPTETTTFASWHRVLDVPEGAATVPIGLPVANTRLEVLDAARRPVPLGAPGELFVGGAGVARGYLHRPELTAERFVPDPSGASPGARLYRTGDLVRRRADGAVEFLGRIDRQVKIRGFRIEPGEIEAALAAHPALRDAAVLVREDLPGDRRLAAYAVAAEGQAAPSAADLQAFLRRTLPEFMVPSAFVFLDALPLTPNGKLDRAALPAPGDADRSRQATFVPPRTGLEERIAAVWREVLGVGQVGIHDNFFDLGGHSLAVVQAVPRLREALGRELTAVDMFQHPTVAALAAALEPEPSRSPAAKVEKSQDRGAARREQLLQRRAAPQRSRAGGSGKDDGR